MNNAAINININATAETGMTGDLTVVAMTDRDVSLARHPDRPDHNVLHITRRFYDELVAEGLITRR